MAGGALGEVPAKAQRMLDIAVANTDRLIRLINDILDIERIESGNVEMQRTTGVGAVVVEAAAEGVRGMRRQHGVSARVARRAGGRRGLRRRRPDHPDP
jgi:signal transduction histidine kinase